MHQDEYEHSLAFKLNLKTANEKDSTSTAWHPWRMVHQTYLT